MLDGYTYGSVGRVSPEAPVPVVSVAREEDKLGGAGNVAANVVALGSEAIAVFALGDDRDGGRARELLEDGGIDCSRLVHDGSVETIRKERVVGNGQQVVRLDYRDNIAVSGPLEERLRSAIESAIEEIDVAVISDYGKGTCTPMLCGELITMCRTRGVPVIVDPKGLDWDKYRGATIITPNLKEMNLFAGTSVRNEDFSVESNFGGMPERLGVDRVLLTRSERGMTLFGEESVMHIRSRVRDVFDVSGAGDTVVAALAVSLGAHGAEIAEAVGIANTAAGIAVGKPGTATVTLHELRSAVEGSAAIAQGNIMDASETSRLEALISSWRSAGETIVTTNGCFDLIHRGHIQLLSEASKLGDRLVVVINSDASVKRLKGESRPLNSSPDRAVVLASMSYVDAVVVFDPAADNANLTDAEWNAVPGDLLETARESPIGVIKAIRPDVHVKGGDYSPDAVPEAIFAGRFASIPFVKGYSSTNLINASKRVD